MYRIAVCEDNAAMRETVCAQCRRAIEELEISGEVTAFSSAEELETVLGYALDPFDLLVLDIQLGGKNGLDLARERRGLDDRVSILFTTSCEEYLREGYAVQPIHFLLKPVTQEELTNAIRTDWRLHHAVGRIALRDGTRTVIVPIRETAYIESRNHQLIIHVSNEERLARLSMAEAERLLPSDCFCRCHNSFLVNFSYISEFCRTEVLLHTGERIPVGRKYYTAAQNAFIHYINH